MWVSLRAPMKVRAVAAPSKDSTSVGTLEVECTPHGLLMVYLAVGAYQEDYAPGAVTSGTRCVAPWPDIVEVRTLGDAILVSLNPALTPHHRLCLKNFSDGDIDEEERSHRKRLLRSATALMMLTVGISLAVSVPVWAPDSGQGLALVLGVLGALAILVVGFVAERLWLPPSLSSEVLRQRLLNEIRYYRPAPVLAAAQQLPPPFDLVELLRALPRSTAAVVIVLSAGSLAAVLTSSWILDAPEPRRAYAPPLEARREPRFEDLVAETPAPAAAPPPQVVASAQVEPATSAPPSNAVAVAESAEGGQPCHCPRADSVLWRFPLPRLSTLLISQRLRVHKEHHHVELELAVVNNGKEPLKEISLQVQFYEDEGKAHTKDRALYYEAALHPGQAIKWHVEARGSSFVINNPLHATLTEGDLATADAFAELLNANHRPVRLHGAMMLAYLDDPRARPGATKLKEALREEEAAFLDRVLMATSSTIACDTRSQATRDGSKVELCVFNRTSKELADLGLKVRGLDREFDFRNPVAAPPLIVTEKVFSLPGVWPPNEGRWVGVEMAAPSEAEQPLKTFEAFVAAKTLLY